MSGDRGKDGGGGGGGKDGKSKDLRGRRVTEGIWRSRTLVAEGSIRSYKISKVGNVEVGEL